GLEPYQVRKNVHIRSTGSDEVRDMAVFRLDDLWVGTVRFETVYAHERDRGRFSRGLLGVDALGQVRTELDGRYGWATFELVPDAHIPLWMSD
ncbi:MAG: hypothetical protein ACI9MC_002283, partial [Kiritimatiellia bacterium]